MIPFKLDGKKYNLPTCWADVTVKQFQELKEFDGNDQIKFYSIMLGVEYSILYRTKQIDVVDKIDPFLQFIKTPLQSEMSVKTILIEGKEYDVPTDLEDYTLAQKIAAWNALSKAIAEKKDPYSALSFVVAIYLQPIVKPISREERQFSHDMTGYSSDAAMKFSKEVVAKLSIVPVYQIGSFFLKHYEASWQKKRLPYPLNQIKNKRLQEWVNSVYLKKQTRLMRSQVETL